MQTSYNYPIPSFQPLSNFFQPTIPSFNSSSQSFSYQTSPPLSALGKRIESPLNFMSEGLEKKLKTIIDNENTYSHYNQLMSRPQDPRGSIYAYLNERPQARYEEMRYQRISELPSTQWNQDSQAFSSIQNYQQQPFFNFLQRGNFIKQEFDLNNAARDFKIKFEQLPKTEQPSFVKEEVFDNDTVYSQSTTDASDVKETKRNDVTGKLKLKVKSQKQLKSKKTKSDPKGPSALAEFTETFPDWDLSTIFDFVKSGKPKEEFEESRKERLLRKIQAAKVKSTRRRVRQHKELLREQEVLKKKEEENAVKKSEKLE